MDRNPPGPPARDAAGGSQKFQRVRIASPRLSVGGGPVGPGSPEPASPGASVSPPLAARQPTLTSDRLRAAHAPSTLVNISLVEERHGNRSWQHRFLTAQRTQGYTVAFITLLLIDVCAAISLLLLSSSYPDCATIVELASCEANVTSAMPPGLSLQLVCDENQSARAAQTALAIVSLVVLVLFVAEMALHLFAVWKCLPRTAFSFRLLLFSDFAILTLALCIESYLLSVGYPTAGQRGLQGSSPVLVLVSRGYRYIQLARRSYAVIGRATRSHSGSAKAVIESKTKVEHELEGYRERQLLARVEDTGRVHPSKLVLQVRKRLPTRGAVAAGPLYSHTHVAEALETVRHQGSTRTPDPQSLPSNLYPQSYLNPASEPPACCRCAPTCSTRCSRPPPRPPGPACASSPPRPASPSLTCTSTGFSNGD